MSKANVFTSREAWLKEATDRLRPLFDECGSPLPANIRHAIGFTSTGRKSKRIGECWHASASGDDHHEIFIRADLAEPVDVLGVLAHELVHAALPLGSGHGSVFKTLAIRIGLEGKMRSTTVGPRLTAQLTRIAADIGPLPHASLDINGTAEDKPKKQTTRMIKAECDTCGYTVRLSRKWVEDVGPPHCPAHAAMTVEMPQDSEKL